jgi:hypothetical protein
LTPEEGLMPDLFTQLTERACPHGYSKAGNCPRCTAELSTLGKRLADARWGNTATPRRTRSAYEPRES